MKELRLNSTGMRRVGDVVGGMTRLRILEVGGSNGIQRWEDVGELPKGLWQLNLKGTPLSGQVGYTEEVSSKYPQLDMIDGRRIRDKNTKRKKPDEKTHVDATASRDPTGGANDEKKLVKSSGDHARDPEAHRSGIPDDSAGSDDADNALDPVAFKVTSRSGSRGKEETKNEERGEPLHAPASKKTDKTGKTKKTKKTKQRADVAAVLHADKADALNSW